MCLYVSTYLHLTRYTCVYIYTYRAHLGYLRAVVLLAAEKLCQLTKIVPLVTFCVAAFFIPPAHAGLVVLEGPELNDCTLILKDNANKNTSLSCFQRCPR